MPLTLVQGPPNSGRAGLVRRGLLDRLDEGPLLVVPTVDDVYRFERELCADGAVIGAEVTTFDGLFEKVATAGGAPLAARLTRAQRIGAISAAAAECRPQLGPLRRPAARPGFVDAFERLLDELQAAGRRPADLEVAAGTLEGSAYLADVADLFAAYARVRDALGAVDRHDVALEAIELLRGTDAFWRRPVFVYGVDDMTPNQLELVRGLAVGAEITVALPYETGNPVLEQRTSPLLEALREAGVAGVVETRPDPSNTASPLLFHLERGFGTAEAPVLPADGSLAVLRSAGARGEAEAIAVEVARLLAAGVEPEEIAVVVRDPARRGPLLSSVLESCGVATALEAEVAVGSTAVGGAIRALLEAEFGQGRAADLLRYLRGPSAVSRRSVDWFERELRRARERDADAALRRWQRRQGALPPEVGRLRAAAGEPSALAAEVAALASEMGARAGGELETRAAGAIANAMRERALLPGLAPAPAELAATLASIPLRVWSGPVEDRVRIADPYRLRAARFDHVFVASLQEGEFPRTGQSGDPFLSEGQRAALGLQPRRDTEAEERYLFHACLALPRERLYLSYRDSDENGVAEPPSPLLDDVGRLIDAEEGEDPLAPVTRSRDLATVVPSVGEAPSESDLARAIAARARDADAGALLRAAAVEGGAAERIAARLERSAVVEAATRGPGPISSPEVLARLAERGAFGGTTLEGFDLCSYRWFVAHELAPEPLDPVPDPLVQGGIAHEALEQLYARPPGGGPLPAPATVGAWIARSAELVAEIAKRRELGDHPAERAMRRRVEGLLARFLSEEAERGLSGFAPWLLEARFADDEDADRPALSLDGWRLHGAIDRVDRAPDGRALVIDYKLSGSVTACDKLEEDAKLQLQLYIAALAELWGGDPAGGIYHPLRGSSSRRPRGLYLEDAAEELAPYGLSKTDGVDAARFESLLDDARRRAGLIVARMRAGDIRRDPGPRAGLRNHDVCPSFCDFATICRRDRTVAEARTDDEEEAEG